MKPRSNIEWQRWAKDDPLYGIDSMPGRHRTGPNPWTPSEFYEHGAQRWSEYLPVWQRYGLNRDSCLEIGCGAGRITRQLVQFFESVYGVDVVREMLDLAHRNVAGAKFILADGVTIPLPENSVSAVFSCEVFQHFDDRAIALGYFSEIHRVLRTGGTCMIHLPIVILPLQRIMPVMGTVQEMLWHMTERWVRAKSNIKRWLISHRNRRAFFWMMQYDPEWLLANLSRIGFLDIEVCLVAVTGIPGHKEVGSFLFARKP